MKVQGITTTNKKWLLLYFYFQLLVRNAIIKMRAHSGNVWVVPVWHQSSPPPPIRPCTYCNTFEQCCNNLVKVLVIGMLQAEGYQSCYITGRPVLRLHFKLDHTTTNCNASGSSTSSGINCGQTLCGDILTRCKQQNFWRVHLLSTISYYIWQEVEISG